MSRGPASSNNTNASLIAIARKTSLLDEEESEIHSSSSSSSSSSNNNIISTNAAALHRSNSIQSNSNSHGTSQANSKHWNDDHSSVFAGLEFENDELLRDDDDASPSSSSVGAAVPELPERIPYFAQLKGPSGGTGGDLESATTCTATTTDKLTMTTTKHHSRFMNAPFTSSTRKFSSQQLQLQLQLLVDDEQGRDDYVRSGTHFRSLLDNAFQKVAMGFSHAGEVEMILTNEENVRASAISGGQKRSSSRRRTRNTDDNDGVRPLRKRRLNGNNGTGDDDDDMEEIGDEPARVSENKHASELAREKVAEVMVLKRVSRVQYECRSSDSTP